ncbi:outer membrane beta-barrel protein [Aquimarina macrocephali]|uniref:outer membrane beta-barrel protein n=1 Tax=Aquimarina macrocephali TaxID=666563 RepID=UPI003F67D055
MKKQSLLLLLMIVSITSYAQIKFEQGYFIDNNGIKTECLIKNVDWHDNPSQIEYKIAEDAEAKMGYIRNIKEFAVSDLKYVKATVNIDMSSEELNHLSINKNPEFKEVTLFLKHIVKGKANLYQYEEGNLIRYFYQVDDKDIEQLIYKTYRVTQEIVNGVAKERTNKIDKNNRYRQQLWTDVKCNNIKESDAVKTNYKKNSLVKYFIKYNRCKDPNFVNTQKREDRDLFNLNIRPGINFSSLSLLDSYTNLFTKSGFDDQTSLRFGIEAEYILPFNKNKWAVFIEPTYQSYKSDLKDKITTFLGTNTRTYTIDYKSIEFPIGLRHYMFLNDKSKLFINAAFVMDYELDATYSVTINDDSTPVTVIDMNTGTNVIAGFGYKYNDRYGIEVRYATNREIGNTFNYSSFSVILGYSLF